MNGAATYQRIFSLDLIRGVVILAILMININYISTPGVLRYNPLAFGDYSSIDQLVWAFEYTFIKQRFMPILTLLYGAGIYLFSIKYESLGKRATKPFIVKSLILVLIGLAHAYLIWDGDILVAYAVCGVVVYFFRNLSNQKLLGIGCVLTILPLLPDVYYSIDSIGKVIEPSANWLPDAASAQQLLKAYQGSWWDTTPARIEAAFSRQTTDFLWFTLWRSCGLMMIGIAFARSGFFNQHSINTIGFKVSVFIGLPSSILGTYFYIQSGYDYGFFSGVLALCFYVGSLSLAYAYLLILIKWGNSQWAVKLQSILNRVGRMALTLYVSQSLICAFIFYGWGLNLYGQISRSELGVLTLVILTLQVLLVIWWSKRFKAGPLETIWRSSYKRFQ